MSQPQFKLNMLHVGICCMLGGIVSGFVPFGSNDASAAAGRGMAVLVMFLIGIGLIVAHIVRSPKNDEKTGKKRPAGKAISGRTRTKRHTGRDE